MNDDTRATAKLPNLEIEIWHRKAPDEGAEYLSLTLRATPDLDTAIAWLDPVRMMQAWASLNPWLAMWGGFGWPMLAPTRRPEPEPPAADRSGS